MDADEVKKALGSSKVKEVAPSRGPLDLLKLSAQAQSLGLLGELRREKAVPVPDYPPEVEWSIEGSSSTEQYPIRMIVKSIEGAIEISDEPVSSHEPDFSTVEPVPRFQVFLTFGEAKWLLQRLPEVIARAEEHYRLDSGTKQADGQ